MLDEEFKQETPQASFPFRGLITLDDHAHTLSNAFIKKIVGRFEAITAVPCHSITTEKSVMYNAFLHGVIGTLTKTVFAENGLRYPPKLDDANDLLLGFVQFLKSKEVTVTVGGTNRDTYTKADINTFHIHMGVEWCTNAWDAVTESGNVSDNTRQHSLIPLESHLHLTMGVIKLMHELAYLFTIPIMQAVDASYTSGKPFKPPRDLGFCLEEIVLGGYRLELELSEELNPIALLFRTPQCVAHALSPEFQRDWMQKFCVGALPASVSHPLDLLSHLKPPRPTRSKHEKRKVSSGSGDRKRKISRKEAGRVVL